MFTKKMNFRSQDDETLIFHTRAPRAIIDPALREPIKKSNVLYGIVMERDISKDSRTFALASVPPRFIKVT